MIATPQTVGFRPGERNIFLHILTGCNLSCRHCYINYEQHGREMLSLAVICRWLEQLQSAKKTNVIFLGGEPTLHPQLPEAIRFAKQLGYAVTVDTNGYLFHDFLQKVQADELDYLSFSLDGPDSAVNDLLRGAGSFAVCSQHLQQAVARGFRVSCIYTVSRANIDALPRIIPLLRSWRVQRFFIQVIGLRGKSAPASSGANTPQVSRDEWLAVVPAVAQQAAAAGLHVIFPKVFLDEGEIFACAGRVAENYFIFPNGRVYQCPLCEDYPLNTYRMGENGLLAETGLREDRLFTLDIPEGCVMNKLLQPDTIEYDASGHPRHRISCCLLKQEIKPFSLD